MRIYPLILLLALTFLSACDSNPERRVKEDEQFQRLYRAVTDVVCTSDRKGREDALNGLITVMGDTTLLQKDGRIHEDLIASIAEDVRCKPKELSLP